MPGRRPAQWKPIGSPPQHRLGTVSLRFGDVIEGAEFDRGEMAGIVRVGEPRDSRSILRSRHGDPQVVEYCTATDDRFPAGMVCGRRCSVRVDEKVQDVVLCHPTPGLAVVHGRSPARQQDCLLEGLYVHDSDAMGTRLGLLGPLVLSAKPLVSLSFHRVCLRRLLSVPVASRQDAREGGFVASCDCARLGTRARVAGWDLLVAIL